MPVALALLWFAVGCTTTAPPALNPPRTTAVRSASPADPFGLGRSGTPGLRVATFAEAMALSDADFDVGKAALLFALESRPDLDVPAGLAQLDAMAADLRAALAAGNRGSRPEIFAAFLYQRFTVDEDDPLGHDPQNLYLDRVLERGKGYCVSLSLLGLAMGERLGLDVRGVRAPFHFYLQIDGQNVETTEGGIKKSDAEYAARAGASAACRAYLRPLPRRAIFADILSNHGGLLVRAGDLAGALQSLDLAIKIDPGLPFAWHNRGVAREQSGDMKGALADLTQALELDPFADYTLTRRARVHALLGDDASAARDLQRAANLLSERR